MSIDTFEAHQLMTSQAIFLIVRISMFSAYESIAYRFYIVLKQTLLGLKLRLLFIVWNNLKLIKLDNVPYVLQMTHISG